MLSSPRHRIKFSSRKSPAPKKPPLSYITVARGPTRHVVHAENTSPLEILRQENELLRKTITEAEAAVGSLESDAKRKGYSSTAVLSSPTDDPVDIWSPTVEVPDNHEMVRSGAVVLFRPLSDSHTILASLQIVPPSHSVPFPPLNK